MNQKGIANTYALKGGTAAWKSAGFPMDGNAQITLQPNAPSNAVPNPPVLSSNSTVPH